MVAVNRLVDEVVVRATTEGVDQATAAGNKLADSVDKVAAAQERQERRTLSVAKAMETFAAKNDAAFRLQQQVERGQALLNRAFEQGLADTLAYQRGVAALAEKEMLLAQASARAATANDNFSGSTQIASHHLTNLSYQLSDVAVSLAGGQSPFLVMLQQGSQIAPILGETGVMGAVRGVGSAIGRFITPATATVGLLTGAVVYGYSAWSRYDDAQKAVGATLQGLGRNVGQTTAEFQGMAEAAGRASNLSARQATDLAKTFAGTGNLDSGNIARLIGVSKDAATTFGMALDDVKTKLADAFSSYAGIEALNRQLNFLDARTQRTIQSLFDQGKAQEAIRLAIEKLPPALAKADDAQGVLARGWEKIKNAILDADVALGRLLDRATKGPTPDQKLKELQDRVEMLKRAEAENLYQPGSASRTYVSPTAPTVASTTQAAVPPGQSAALKQAQAELTEYSDGLEKLRQKQKEVAEQRALEESLTKKSNELHGLVKEVGAGSDEWVHYRDLQQAVDAALKSGNPDLMKRVDSVRDLKEAQDVLRQVTESTTNAEGERMTAAEKAERQRQVEIAGTRAMTYEDRARVAQMRTEEQQRGQLITKAQAQADAEHAAQMVREEEARQLREMLRDQKLEADTIQQNIGLLGLSDEARAAAIAKRKTEADLTRQGIGLNSDLAQRVIAGAEANARLGVSYDKAAEALQRLRDGQREMAQTLTTFFDTLLSGTGKLDTALSSLSRSIGSGGLQAILMGQGPYAEMFGTASPDKGKVGGLFGGILPGFKDAVKEGAQAGTQAGTSGGFSDWFKSANGQRFVQGAAGIIAIGGSYSAGASASSRTQATVSGALSGAVGGFMLGNAILPGVGGAIGAAAGSVFGAVLSRMGYADAAKTQKRQALVQAQAEYAQNKPAIETLRAGLRGEATGGVENSIRAMNQQVQQAAQEAAKAGDTATVNALAREFALFVDRARAAFTRTFEGTLADLYAGLGPNGPFTQAAAAVAALGESLKNFVADAAVTGNTARARVVAQEAALASLDPQKSLSETQNRLREIAGTAAGLSGVLQDLGLSADEAAAAIRDRTVKAIDALKASFADDLTRKINAASGKDYLNSLADLAKERASLLSDAAALGMDGAKVQAYVSAAAQKIIDDSQLTGDAFTALSDQFPDLTSGVHAFSEALDTASAKAAAASRALGYQDRLFATTNDTSTLAGQLAAYDRKAAQERQAEIEAGGQALADLERAQYAERAKIETDYYDQVVQTQKQALEQARQAYDTFARNIRSYLDNLRAGSSSPLSPQARLAAAQSQYTTQLALAQGGNRDALDAITGYANDLLDAAKAFYASSSGFQTIFSQVTGQLAALPSQVSPEQFIVDGVSASVATMREALRAAVQANSPSLIATALGPNFNTLTATTGGLLSLPQFQAAIGPLATVQEQQQAAAIFRAIDTDGDNMISSLELLRTTLKAAIDAGSAQATANALAPQFSTLTGATNGLLNLGQFQAAIGPLATTAEQQAARAIFAAIDADGDGQINRLELIRAQAGATAANTDATRASVDATRGSVDYGNAVLNQQKAVLDAVSAFTSQTKAAVDAGNTITNAVVSYTAATNDNVAAGNNILNAINGLSGLQKQQLELLNSQFTTRTPVTYYGSTLNNNMLDALNKIVFNTGQIVIATKSGGKYGDVQYASGGWVSGPGTGTSDSIPAMLSNGEFVVTAAAARANARLLEAMNENPGGPIRMEMPAQAVMPLAMPMPAMGGLGGNADVVAVIRTLIDRIGVLEARLVAAEAAGAQHVREGVDEHRDETRRARTDARQAASRPPAAGSRAA